MSYQEDIKQKILTIELWPDFDRPEFLAILDELAEESLKKNNVEGALASVLIYHQLSEELLQLLLESAQFLIQLAIFPEEIKFPPQRRQMYGQLLKELKSTMSFTHKQDILKLCTSLNKDRIEIVHRLASRLTLDDVVYQANDIQKTYWELFWRFEEAYDYFRVSFSDFKKNVFSDYF